MLLLTTLPLKVPPLIVPVFCTEPSNVPPLMTLPVYILMASVFPPPAVQPVILTLSLI